MKGVPILIPLALFALSACNHTNTASGPLLLSSSFEGDDPFRAWSNSQHCCDYSVAQSNVHSTDSSHALRLEVRSTDKIVSRSIRSELVQPVDGIGEERWYGFSMYLENWIYDDASEDVFQWHPGNPDGVATAAMWTSAGRYIFVTNSTGGNKGNQYNDLGPLDNDEWVAWVIHVRWASDSTGILQLWKNGKLMIDQSGIPTAPPEGTYFKLGINKFGWLIQPSSVTRRVLYFDEVRIGNAAANYDTVKPRGTSRQVHVNSRKRSPKAKPCGSLASHAHSLKFTPFSVPFALKLIPG